MIADPTLAGEALKARVRSAGAVAVGFTAAAPVSDAAMASFDRWIASGAHAGMRYMEGHRELRRDPRLLLDGAASIISIAFCYRPEGDADNPYLARYALLPDYHDYIRARLRGAALGELLGEEGKDWRICVDSAPVMERYWAQRAGIGIIGDNGALIVPGVGPEVFLAEIITTLRLNPDAPSAGGCSHCGRCRAACPGSALQPANPYHERSGNSREDDPLKESDNSGKRREADSADMKRDTFIDCNRCLSYLTIEHRGDFTDPRHLALLSTPEGRNTLFGCDRCIRVCPHNNPDITSGLTPTDALLGLTPGKVLSLTPEEFSRQFRGTSLKRARLAGLLRNARH